MNSNPESQDSKLNRLHSIEKQLREYRRQHRKVKREQKEQKIIMDSLNISILKVFDDKVKGRFRCKALTAHSRYGLLLAHETRLTRYINELEKEKQLLENGQDIERSDK